VCVPLDPRTSDSFDPLTVPTVGSLLNELNAKTASDQTAEVTKVQPLARPALVLAICVCIQKMNDHLLCARCIAGRGVDADSNGACGRSVS
jgi:hypothetical protein